MPEYSFDSPRPRPYGHMERGIYPGVVRNTAPLPLDIHVHREAEVGMVLAGEERLAFSDYQFTCYPGDVWLCGVGEPHGYSKPAGTAALVIIFTPEFIGEEMLGEMPWLTLFSVPPADRPRVTSEEMRGRVLAIGRVLAAEVQEKRADWEQVARLEMLRLFFELNRGWDRSRLAAPPVHVRVRDLARVMPAFALVHSVPWRRVSVPEAAASCGLSPSRFHRLFQNTTGSTFGAFCLRQRLSYAAQQLLKTDQTVATIAQDVGFADDSHLHHAFVKHYGCTPAEYRKSGRFVAA